ncbi:hypothetical protein [Aeromonas salmonicida]|uniref:hypothetical protein n=1 Tax=Aeromonas salmonicida TaxID=645 RepID=UPI00283AA6A0|nr:hypothetical protein [Aeromonas salmonicida]
MDNIEQFSIYTAKIFEELYSSFPVPKRIDNSEMISLYLSFDKHDEIKKLHSIKSRAELVGILKEADPEAFEEIIKPQLGAVYIDETLVVTEGKLRELEFEKQNEIRYQMSILSGTIDFLESEGLIVFVDKKGYRLSSKSFSHLNKSFKNGKVENDDESYIVAIKNMFGQARSMSKEVVVGTAITIIPKLLGYS